MSSLSITPQWNDEINQVEPGELISAGPNGNANIATRQLAENIWYLKDKTKNDLFLKADKATTLAGYGISDAYTKTEVDNKLTAKVDKTDVIDVAHGGTGSTNAATARSNLGLGAISTSNMNVSKGSSAQLDLDTLTENQFVMSRGITSSVRPLPYESMTWGFVLSVTSGGNGGGDRVFQIIGHDTNKDLYFRKGQYTASVLPWYKFLHSGNTQVDTSNGYIKGASPIIKLFTDKIELNDEAKLQPITLEKLGVGDYLIKGSLGFAQEGWYIETPRDANGNVLVAVVYKQLANNDISVKTYAKMFDPDTGDIVANTTKPRDIPSTRWIDLRLQELPQTDVNPTDETVATNAE